MGKGREAEALRSATKGFQASAGSIPRRENRESAARLSAKKRDFQTRFSNIRASDFLGGARRHRLVWSPRILAGAGMRGAGLREFSFPHGRGKPTCECRTL